MTVNSGTSPDDVDGPAGVAGKATGSATGRDGKMPPSRTSAGSWSASLESWARTRYGAQRLAVSSTMDFAPQGTLRPHTFYGLPVVLIVMTRSSAPMHAGLAQGVELIREATYGFRVVVLTDEPAAESLREVDFSVEHCLGEVDWAALHGSNWLTEAADHLDWTRRQYGASMILAPERPEQVIDDLARLGAAFEAPEKVLATAAEIARDALDSVQDPQLQQSLRGWWGELGPGRRHRKVTLGDLTLSVTVEPAEGAGVLVGLGSDTSPLVERARAGGWTNVLITAQSKEGASQGPAAPGAEHSAAAVAEESQQARLLAACLRAAAEGVDTAGPSFLIESREAPAREAEHIGVDGVITVSSEGRCQVTMDYGSSLDCSEEDLLPSLERIRGIHLRTAV